MKRKLNEHEVGQRLRAIPCVGTLTASTISTEPGDEKQYASSRDFAAATALVPRQYSTGGQTTLLGNKKIRTLLVQCARVFIQKLEHHAGKLADSVRELLCRKRAAYPYGPCCFQTVVSLQKSLLDGQL